MQSCFVFGFFEIVIVIIFDFSVVLVVEVFSELFVSFLDSLLLASFSAFVEHDVEEFKQNEESAHDEGE